MRKIYKSVRDLRTNIHLMDLSRIGDKWGETVPEEIIAENLPQLKDGSPKSRSPVNDTHDGWKEIYI